MWQLLTTSLFRRIILNIEWLQPISNWEPLCPNPTSQNPKFSTWPWFSFPIRLQIAPLTCPSWILQALLGSLKSTNGIHHFCLILLAKASHTAKLKSRREERRPWVQDEDLGPMTSSTSQLLSLLLNAAVKASAINLMYLPCSSSFESPWAQ